jgi:hypothetical protein
VSVQICARGVLSSGMLIVSRLIKAVPSIVAMVDTVEAFYWLAHTSMPTLTRFAQFRRVRLFALPARRVGALAWLTGQIVFQILHRFDQMMPRHHRQPERIPTLFAGLSVDLTSNNFASLVDEHRKSDVLAGPRAAAVAAPELSVRMPARSAARSSHELIVCGLDPRCPKSTRRNLLRHPR